MASLKALLLAIIVACTAGSPVESNYFARMNGCFLLYNVKTAKFVKVIGETVCKKRFSASSTFKVPLAVMAFDSGVLKNENEVLKWDGKKEAREALNQDHNSKTWMRDSVVWFSQRLTPKIGEEKIRQYLRGFHYGNEDLSGGLTSAWLNPPNDPKALAVSAFEQVEFMKNLWTDKLPVSKRAMQIARDITYLETSPQGFKLHGKTGSNYFNNNPKHRLGWFIGHLQKEGQEYLVVTAFTDVEPTNQESYGGLQAKEITKRILKDQGIW